MLSRNKTGKAAMVSYLALMTAISVIIGYLEMLIPINVFGIPGVKLGLANTVSLTALYLFEPVHAYCIMIARVLIIGFMFGNMYAIIYSLAGGVLSITVMLLLRRTGLFSMTGVSAAGGVFHNVGQLIIAFIFLNGTVLVYYIPLLTISGTVCGSLTGLVAHIITERIGGSERYDRISQRQDRSDI